jgi:hypothetical protein
MRGKTVSRLALSILILATFFVIGQFIGSYLFAPLPDRTLSERVQTAEGYQLAPAQSRQGYIEEGRDTDGSGEVDETIIALYLDEPPTLTPLLHQPEISFVLRDGAAEAEFDAFEAFVSDRSAFLLSKFDTAHPIASIILNAEGGAYPKSEYFDYDLDGLVDVWMHWPATQADGEYRVRMGNAWVSASFDAEKSQTVIQDAAGKEIGIGMSAGEWLPL